MNAKSRKNLFVAIAVSLTAVSCSLGGKDYAMTSDESITKVKELVKANVDTETNKVYRIEWTEDEGNRKLENVLTQIEVDYLGNDDYEYELTINYRDGEFVAEKPEKGSAVYDSYKYSTAIDIDGLKAEDIRGNVEKAGELVAAQEDGAQYEFQSVGKYVLYISPVPKKHEDKWEKWSDEYKNDYRQLQHNFDLNFVKKGEQSEVKGHRVWTNYYSISFETSKNGEIVIEHKNISRLWFNLPVPATISPRQKRKSCLLRVSRFYAARLSRPPMPALPELHTRISVYYTTKHCVVSWWDGMMSVISCFVKLNILYPAAHYQVWSGFRKLFSVTSMRKTDLSIRCLKVPHLHLHTRYFCV